MDDPIGFAKACEAWVLSMAGIGFEFGQAADPVLVESLVEAISRLPADAVDHQVWLRSMLVSVLLEDDDEAERREALSEEALAIASGTDDPGIVASALHGRRLAVWRRDRLDERLALSQQAVAHAHRAGDVHLELTAMLVAMADLLESGRVDEQLAMLARFRERAATLHTPVYDTYTNFLYSCRLIVTGDYDEARRIADDALASGLAAHGISTEMAHAGQLFCRAWDHDELGELVDVVEATANAHPDFPIWRVALVGCLVAAGRPQRAAEVLAELVTPDGVQLRDNSMYFTAACFLVEGARALDDRMRAGVLLETLRPYAGTGRHQRPRWRRHRSGAPVRRCRRPRHRRARHGDRAAHDGHRGVDAPRACGRSPPGPIVISPPPWRIAPGRVTPWRPCTTVSGRPRSPPRSGWCSVGSDRCRGRVSPRRRARRRWTRRADARG